MEQINPLINLSDFFNQKKLKSEAFNNEIADLKKRLKDEIKPTVLFSLKLGDTDIVLGKDIREVFGYQFHKYPEDGLYLQSVEVSNISTVGDNFSFGDYLDLTFKMNNDNWSGKISFSKIGFDDEKLRIVENSMGVCYEPRFVLKEKYIEVKNFIQSVQSQIKEYFE